MMMIIRKSLVADLLLVASLANDIGEWYLFGGALATSVVQSLEGKLSFAVE